MYVWEFEFEVLAENFASKVNGSRNAKAVDIDKNEGISEEGEVEKVFVPDCIAAELWKKVVWKVPNDSQ